jgi:hypothetical protein
VPTDGLCQCRFFDIDHDRDIDYDDFNLFLRRYTGPMNDCDGNQTVDLYDLIDGTHPDCNLNGVPDSCDLEDGTSKDNNGNSIPDECCLTSSTPQPEMILDTQKSLETSTKNRFLSFTAGDGGQDRTIRVKFVDLPGPYSQFNGKYMWVGDPFDVSEIAARTDTSPPTFKAAKLQCDKPTPRSDWSDMGTIHVYGEFVVPDGTYEIALLHTMCAEAEADDPAVSPALILETSPFGDVCAGLPKNNDGQWGPPDGVPNMTRDVLAIKQKFGNHPGLIKARAELGAAVGTAEPDLIIDMSKDVLYAKFAFTRRPYDMFFPPPPWPCP